MIFDTFPYSFMRTAFVTVDFTNRAQTKLSSREPIILGFLGRSFTKMWTGNFFHFTVRVPKKIFFSEELQSTKFHSMVNWILKFLLSCLHKLFITPNYLLQLSKLSKNNKKWKTYSFMELLSHLVAHICLPWCLRTLFMMSFSRTYFRALLQWNIKWLLSEFYSKLLLLKGKHSSENQIQVESWDWQ